MIGQHLQRDDSQQWTDARVGSGERDHIVGVTLEVLGLSSRWTIVALTSLGCLCLLYAAYQLVRESFLSLESIEGHLKQYRLANQGESYDKR